MNPQLDLFGTPPAPDNAPLAACPAERDTGLRELAARLAPGIRLGTSSWSPARHPLIRAVALDRTFYAPIGEETYRRHAEQVPDGFRILVKAPQTLTSAWIFESREPSPHFLDAAAARDLFVAPCLAGLGAAAGPLVFQFPRQGRAVTREPSPFADRLHRFLRGLPRGALYAVELRDRELLGPGTMRALADTGTRLCLSVHARLPPVLVQAAAATSLGPGALVVRWNLHAAFADGEEKSRQAPFDRVVDEDPVTRLAIAGLVRDCVARGDEAWVIANHKAEGSAPHTLERLARAIVDGAA